MSLEIIENTIQEDNIDVIVRYFTKDGTIGNPEELKHCLKNFLFESFSEAYKAVYSGLTGNELRDKIAIGALQGLMQNLNYVAMAEKELIKSLARLAYKYADAMLEFR